MKLGRWSDHFVVWSREYSGGVLAGIGLGVIITKALLASSEHTVIFHPLMWALACGCIAVGSVLARAAQRRRFRSDLDDDNHEA